MLSKCFQISCKGTQLEKSMMMEVRNDDVFWIASHIDNLYNSKKKQLFFRLVLLIVLFVP